MKLLSSKTQDLNESTDSPSSYNLSIPDSIHIDKLVEGDEDDRLMTFSVGLQHPDSGHLIHSEVRW
jgi:hypothetical protein